jgi:hypothetical protein
MRILLLFPTRNRSDLAENAIKSVMEQLSDRVDLLVSDNSTEVDHCDRLRGFCQAQAGVVRYLTPPSAMPMAEHWDWVLGQALQSSMHTHVCMLTDRMVMRPGALQNLLSICTAYPDITCSFPVDTVVDNVQPIRLDQVSWTGKLLRLATADLARLILYRRWAVELPRLSNSITPIHTLAEVKRVFGNICNSTAPDLAFGFRLICVQPHLYWFDKPLAISYALSRSNGISLHSMAPEDMNAHARDFLRDLGGTVFNYACPTPGLNTLAATVYHEYELARRSCPYNVPKINLAAYTRLLIKESRRAKKRPNLRYAINATIKELWANRARTIMLDFLSLYAWRVASYYQPRLVINRLSLKFSKLLLDSERGWLVRVGLISEGQPIALHRVYLSDTESALRYAHARPMPKRKGPAIIEGRVACKSMSLDGTLPKS